MVRLTTENEHWMKAFILKMISDLFDDLTTHKFEFSFLLFVMIFVISGIMMTVIDID